MNYLNVYEFFLFKGFTGNECREDSRFMTATQQIERKTSFFHRFSTVNVILCFILVLITGSFILYLIVIFSPNKNKNKTDVYNIQELLSDA